MRRATVPVLDDEDLYELADNGLFVRTEPVRAVDLFCGCGGFSLGMQQAGIDVIAALEWEPHAIMTYLTNLGSRRGCSIAYVSDEDQRRFAKVLAKSGESKESGWVGRGWVGRNGLSDGGGCRAMVIGDARHVTGDMFREALSTVGERHPIDVVIGGPPCQGMSKAGKQRPDDPRNNLVLEFWRIADELGASVVMMENVPPLMTEAKFRPLFDAIVGRAHAAGFTITANVLDAVNYGVPQFRRRAFVVGTRGAAAGRFDFPLPTHWNFVSRPGEKRVEHRRPGTRTRKPKPARKRMGS